MLKKLILENWKSFRYAELPIDPLTILIGANASGKSNAIEALDFLEQFARDKSLDIIFSEESSAIRCDGEQIVNRAERAFKLTIVLGAEEVSHEYKYSCTVEVKPELNLKSESWSTVVDGKLSSQIDSLSADRSWLRPRSRMSWDKEGASEAGKILNELEKITVFRPIPSKIRGYSRVAKELSRDASNIAGFLSSFTDKKKHEIESQLTSYVDQLLSQDISRIWTEKVGRASADAMLYGEEKWKESTLEIDARSMSDGTLNFISILTALLTCEPGSQLVIEDIDDGLHPSRAQLLLRAIRDIGEQRKVDVLVTTHNPALLDSLEQGYLPFVVVAHRDSNTGESLLTPLDKLENLPKLLASASLGDLVTQGAIERNLDKEAIAP